MIKIICFTGNHGTISLGENIGERVSETMANKQIFNEIKAKHFETLEQYVPVVARVHGKHHPEFLDVHKLVNAMAVKIKEAGLEIPALGEEFEKLRGITDGYTVPDDVCESYEAVYNMLSELDQAYQA